MQSTSCLPTLPGHVFQPVVTFHDASGRYTYQLNLVYAPTADIRPGIEGCVLRPELSFWCVSWSYRPGSVHEAALGRWVSYARARKLLGRRMTFASFCSLGDMISVVPDLLKMNDPDEKPGDEVMPIAVEEGLSAP